MTVTLMLALLGCPGVADKGVVHGPPDTSPAVAGDPAPDDSGPADPDGDGDGVAASQDCDDADPAIYPGATEVCDGLDQDCDGAADDGVPSDGAGCQEPAAPVWDETVQIVHITARTGDGEHDGTDDYVSYCLSATDCLWPDNVDWDDIESGQTDVFAIEDLALSRAALDRLTVTVEGGTDQWAPTCLAVSVDGEPLYCKDELSLKMGEESDETLSWTDPDGLVLDCLGCFDAPLTHGPIVGATGPDRAQIWLRTDATRRVALRIATSPDALVEAAPVAIGYPAAEDDFALALSVVGLSPDTRWYYDLELEGARYGPWSFATSRAAEAVGVTRLGFGSCSKEEDQPIWDTILAYAPDLWIFVGDNHYANSDDLGTLRTYYRHAHAVPQRAALMAGTPTLATWDDHDYVGNNTDGSEPGRDTALRAFREYWANGSYGTDEIPGVFSAQSWGDLQIVLLDDRYYRGLDDSILGDAQEQWLYDELLGADATFRFLITGSQWTTQGTDDSWGVYPEAQARVLQYIADNAISGVVLLSGDIHRSELRLLPGASGGYDLPELTSSPLANSTATCKHESEEIDCYDDGNSFVLVDVDTSLSDPELTARIVAEDGAIVASWTIARSELE